MLIKKVFSACLITLIALQAAVAEQAITTTTTTATAKAIEIFANVADGRRTNSNSLRDAEALAKAPNAETIPTKSSLTANRSLAGIQTVEDKEHPKDGNDVDNNQWDVLIFTQQWPPTTCYHWIEHNIKHKCRLPSNKELWSIHGIWPTRYGEIGPNYCNKSADFNLTVLQTIMQPLNSYWPDIYGNNTDNMLWKHEWLKHGTCAESLAELSDELKYFRQALLWHQLFPIERILAASGIYPDTNHTILSIHMAITNSLHKNPSIHCLYDDKTNTSLLQEIRLCFDKQLALIDCNNVKHDDAITIDYPGGSVITNCHISKLVVYPSLVPRRHYRRGNKTWQFPIVNLYKLIQFISWVTL